MASQSVFVLGGTGHVGVGIVSKLLAAGYRVCVASRRTDLTSFHDEVGQHLDPGMADATLTTVQGDASSAEFTQQLKSQGVDLYDFEHVIFSLSPHASPASFKDHPWSSYAANFNSIVGAVHGVAQSALQSPEKLESISIVTGTGGERAFDGVAPGTVTQAALFGISAALRNEYEHGDVRINELRLGMMIDKAMVTDKAICSRYDVGQALLALLNATHIRSKVLRFTTMAELKAIEQAMTSGQPAPVAQISVL
eukprot:TRINITY_DN4421_c0_g1_i1.p1 TRINITY_DN4421_c0_g1~~TRINITY_DN4421_c0_g1_i1.p1  ORF type:complete len:253 (+),score=52.31 TRINITY_DN4421_c0_g1_i1:208-966(+)